MLQGCGNAGSRLDAADCRVGGVETAGERHEEAEGGARFGPGG